MNNEWLRGAAGAAFQLAVAVLGAVACSYLAGGIMSRMMRTGNLSGGSGGDDVGDGDHSKRKKLQGKLVSLLKERQVSLDSYERRIADSLISSDMIDVGFGDIGGMEETKKEIVRTILFPMTHPHLFNNPNSLRQAVKGVLLYGPPGTGKTMLAKAIAKELGDCFFINLQRQKVDSFLFGESEKYTCAIFSLARKIQPCIIFIDEIDAMLANRSGPFVHDVRKNEVSLFLSQWDGFLSSNTEKVIVVGATNMRESIDPAAARRMPLQIHVGLPSKQARKDILSVLLKNEHIEEQFPFDDVAMATEGFSGSDLKELCKRAVMYPIYEAMEQPREQQSDDHESQRKLSVRCVTRRDFQHALRHIRGIDEIIRRKPPHTGFNI